MSSAHRSPLGFISAIPITDADRSAGGLTPANLALALDIMRTDGALVLEQAVKPDHISRLRERMEADLERVLARSDAPFNFNRGNIQQSPPRERDLLFRDVLLNDAAIAVSAGLMGPGVRMANYTGNTALVSDQRQPVHVDWGQLWPGLEVAPPPYAVVVNVPLVEMDVENGSTELWLGTHLDTTVARNMDVRIPADVLAQRRVRRPPIQAAIRTGSIILRDARLWHAGMPNRSPRPRPMIAMAHMAGFYQLGANDMPVFPAWAKPLLAHTVLSVSATWIDEDQVDHTKLDHAYGYSPSASG